MGADLNYFSEKEQKLILKVKEVINKIVLPVSKILIKLGLTANVVSLIGFLTLSGFIYYIQKNPVIALLFLFLHVFIDIFDGHLARLQKQDGNSGAFTDIICDHTGMAIVIISLIWVNLVNPVIASIYIYLYTILIIFVIARNKMNIPIKFVIRTKYYVYILFGVYAIWNINKMDEGLVIFTILMIPSIISSYLIIKKNLK